MVNGPMLNWKALRLFFGVAFAIIALALIAGSTAEAKDTRLLAKEGESTTGTVLSSHSFIVRNNVAETRSSVRFTTLEGQTVTRSLIDCGDRPLDQVGSTVPVEYASSDPSVARFGNLSCKKVKKATGFVVAGSICGVIALTCFAWSFIDRRKRKRLTKEKERGSQGPASSPIG
jgi:hypothetical protein